MQKEKASRLKRPRHAMPRFVRDALEKKGLMTVYRSRPPYQQNDYLGWIMRAKRDETRQSRLEQMLDELFRDDRYMNMPYHGSSKSAAKK